MVTIPNAVRMQRNYSVSHTGLMGMQNGTTTSEHNWWFFKLTKHPFIRGPSNCIPGHYSQRNENSYSHKKNSQMFIAVLFIVAQTGKNQMSSKGDWINKLVKAYHGN
jgi:hypothetical protein